MDLDDVICRATGARSARRTTRIAELWDGWGEIVRYDLEAARWPSVVVKHIRVPEPGGHLQAWDSDRRHARKLKSYAVERTFYTHWLAALPRDVHFARPLHLKRDLFVLEDLDLRFPGRAPPKGSLPDAQVEQCLRWLAGFHAAYLGRDPVGLWDEGTYWHLDTRPDELERMADGPLKTHARAIDRALAEIEHRTIVHGDAKVANFCFAEHTCAAVDFQYVGGGCGLKDVAYFLSSALRPWKLGKHADRFLDVYFEHLHDAIGDPSTARAVEAEWRPLWSLAWADYERFVAGWAPDRSDRDGYAAARVEQALEQVGV